MTYSLGGIALSGTLDGGGTGQVQEENIKKESFITQMPAYLLDSDETYAFDFGGAVRTVTITGRATGTLAQIQALITSIEALIQGHQDIDAGYPKDYISDLKGTIKVKILDFDYTWYAGDPNQLYYTLKLIEASTAI